MRTSCNIFFPHFILYPKRKNATETQYTDNIYNNERYVQSNV